MEASSFCGATSRYFISSLVASYYYVNAGKLRTAAEFYFAFLWLNLDSKKEIGAQTLFAPQVAMVTVRARKRSVTVGVLRFGLCRLRKIRCWCGLNRADILELEV
jgi:hypothetical protein